MESVGKRALTNTRETTGCGRGARILDCRGMNPALYCLSYTARIFKFIGAGNSRGVP